MEKLQERNSNFELLRIIAMLFIVLYHIIIHGQVLGNSVNAGLSIIIYLVMYMTLVHVNSFILLTGFFQSTGKFKQSKVWSLINSSLFYKFLIVIVFSALGILSLSKIELLKEFFILNLSEYWYVKIYLFLYCLSPFINKLINHLTKKDYETLLLATTVIFSIIPYVTGNDGFENNGYTLYSFIYLYFIGGYMRRYPIEKSYLFKRCSKHLLQVILIIIFCSCILLNFSILKTAESLVGINSIFDEIASNLINMSILYSNPIIIVQSIVFVAFFSTLNIKSKVINGISKLTLGVYLIHDNNFVREQLYTWLKINNGPIYSYKFLFYIFLMSILIFSVCALIEWLRQQLFKFIYNRKISEKIRKKYYNWLHSLRIEDDSCEVNIVK